MCTILVYFNKTCYTVIKFCDFAFMYKIKFVFQISNSFCFFLIIDPSGWWTGKIGRKEGLFPSNYVEEL